MLRVAVFALGICLATVGVRAQDEADLGAFVGEGMYSPTTGCAKLLAIEKGDASPNIASYPLTLTREGTGSWEGGCKFTSVKTVKPNVFEAKMDCSEGAEEYEETVTFTRLDANRIDVAGGGEYLVYERCTALKGKVER
ncbi:hypothetical protein DLM45_13140 [Hyphomicrobium methylovorum]|uniref:hypothetical protein n=1 Tax=Hyphomicrobium methylovorum TaxID=84 RepID=UPI0015E6CB16|nr:hypothetical protein [Hyphomicrobium methylovorum]MBA2127159.1 hypothetical protein [Hyphomicrobium methylovorum]